MGSSHRHLPTAKLSLPEVCPPRTARSPLRSLLCRQPQQPRGPSSWRWSSMPRTLHCGGCCPAPPGTGRGRGWAAAGGRWRQRRLCFWGESGLSQPVATHVVFEQKWLGMACTPVVPPPPARESPALFPWAVLGHAAPVSADGRSSPAGLSWLPLSQGRPRQPPQG